MVRKTVRILSGIPALLLILFAVVNFAYSLRWSYADAVGGTPTLCGTTLTVVVSGSMEPTIPTGSLVVTRAKDTYEIGDIVLYKSKYENGIYVLHRIIDTDGKSFVLQGDANLSPDPLAVDPSQIVGEVVFTNYYLGVFRTFLATPLGACIFAGGCYVLLSFGLRKIEEVSNDSYAKITNRRS